MGTHSFLSLSHHSCLFFLLLPCPSSSVNGGSPGLSSAPEDGGWLGVWRGGLTKSPEPAKDRCRPRYERLIMVLTDKLLSESVDGARWLPQLHSSCGRLSRTNCCSERCCRAPTPHTFKDKQWKIIICVKWGRWVALSDLMAHLHQFQLDVST